MEADSADDHIQSRLLLEEILGRVRSQLPLAGLLAPGADAEHVAAVLAPVARADGTIDWIAVNGQRVDAVVTAGDAQWRVVLGRSSASTIESLEVFHRPRRFDGVEGGRAIVVNGPSGAGKSTLLRALQHIAPMPMVILDEPEHIGTVQAGYLIWRDRAPALHRGYLQALAALARAGNHVAISAAGHRRTEFDDAFGDVPTVSIGLTCESAVLIERERRTGRWGGIASDAATIHDGWAYDLQFDTTDQPDPLELARRVLDRIGRNDEL